MAKVDLTMTVEVSVTVDLPDNCVLVGADPADTGEAVLRALEAQVKPFDIAKQLQAITEDDIVDMASNGGLQVVFATHTTDPDADGDDAEDDIEPTEEDIAAAVEASEDPNETIEGAINMDPPDLVAYNPWA